MLTAHGGHAQVCAVRTQNTGFQGPGTETPSPFHSPCKPLSGHLPAQSLPLPQVSPRLSGADQALRHRIAGPHGAEEREGACGGQRSELQGSSLAPAPGTRSSQTNGSDPERGHSGRFRCPDSGSWVSGPGAGAGSPPHRLRACPRYSVHWKQSRFIEAGLSQLVCLNLYLV